MEGKQAGRGRFAIKPVDPSCGPELELAPLEPLTLGRQHLFTSEKDALRCSRKQAVLNVQGDFVEVECCGQNPIEIHAKVRTEGQKDVLQKVSHVFCLKTGQRAKLQDGDVFSLIVGGCLLTVVRCKESLKNPIEGLDKSPSKFLPATIRSEGSKRVTARTSERLPRVSRSADAVGTVRDREGALGNEGRVCKEEAQVCDQDPDLKEQTVPLRRQGQRSAFVLQDKTAHESGSSGERKCADQRGTEREIDQEVIPDSEDVCLQTNNRRLGEIIPGTFSREQIRPQWASNRQSASLLEDQVLCTSKDADGKVPEKFETRAQLGPQKLATAETQKRLEDRPSISEKPSREQSKRSCRDANISRWTFEVQKTPPLLRSPASSLPSRLQSAPAPKFSCGSPGNEATSSKDSEGSRFEEERQLQAVPKRNWSPGKPLSKSDASCSSENSKGSSSEEERRPQAGVRKQWSPPKPPSSDREDDSSGSERFENFEWEVEKHKDKKADAGGRVSLETSLSSDTEAFRRNSKLGQAHLSARRKKGSAKEGEQEKETLFGRANDAEKKRPLSEDESPASSEDLLGIGQADNAGKHKAAVRRSSSPETKQERRRLRKIGKSALKGRRVQGHGFLLLTTRAVPGDLDGLEKGERRAEASEEAERFGDLGAWEDVEMNFEEPLVDLAPKADGNDKGELSERPRNRMALPDRPMQRCIIPDRLIERNLSLDHPIERCTSSDRWIERSLSLDRPIEKCTIPDRPMERIGCPKDLHSLCITSTGYRGAQKEKLQEIVSSMGAKYSGDLTLKNTHLVCNEFSGGKFLRAVEWGIPRVNHAWLQDCVWQNEVLSEEGYCEKAGNDIAPLPESQPCSSPVEPFTFPQPLPNEHAPAVPNERAPAVLTEAPAVAKVRAPAGASEHSDSGLSEDSLSDGQERSATESDGQRAPKSWIPPAPQLSEDSQSDFEEWKKRRDLEAKKEESDCREVDEDSAERASNKGRNQERKRLGGGKRKHSGTDRANESERGKRKSCRRKSSLSEGSASEEELGVDRSATNWNRNMKEKAGGSFRVGGKVYEERGRAREYDSDVTEGVSEEKRPLKRLKKLKVGKGSRPRRQKEVRKQDESRRKEGTAERGWEGFDPKDWVDWNDRGTNAGIDIEGQADLEERAQVRREDSRKFEGQEKRGLWETSLGRSGAQNLQTELPAQRGSDEPLRARHVSASEPLDGHVSRSQRLSDAHVSRSQRSEGPSLGSLPCTEHPVYLPSRRSQQEERPQPSDEPQRTSQDRPGVRQKSLESVWAKAGVSLRDDLPVRKKRRAERVQGLAGKGPLERTTPVKMRTPEQNKIALMMMKSPSPGGDTACVICLATRVNAVQGVLPCGHEFCYSCVMSWAAVKADSKRECPLCKTPYDIITKRHVAGSDGVSPEDEIVPLGVGPQQVDEEGPVCMYCKGGNVPDLMLQCSGCETGSAHTFCLDPPLMNVPQGPWFCERCERRRATRAAYERKGAGRRSNGLGERRQRSNGPKDLVPAIPAGGIDPSFGRFLSGQQPRAVENLRRTLPTRWS